MLHRLYTQNIDALELKVGLELPDPNQLTARCIPLHGSLTYVKCTVCHGRQRMEPYFQDFKSGTPPTCPACLKDEKARQAGLSPKRPRKVGQLRPDILLYGEPNPWGDTTADIITKDTKSVTPKALLLVVGTSLKICGIQDLIKCIGGMVKAKGGYVININQTASELAFRRFFDLEILGDCQVFAELVIERFKEKEKGKGKGKDSIKHYENGAATRADFRPLWDWIY